MIANVDGYIIELPAGAEILEFRSGRDHTAGTLVVRDAAGEKIDRGKCIAAEFNLPQKPWWERLADASLRNSEAA